jgi:hypothetical protein
MGVSNLGLSAQNGACFVERSLNGVLVSQKDNQSPGDWEMAFQRLEMMNTGGGPNVIVGEKEGCGWSVVHRVGQ